jgi:hypothetical protein
MINPIEYFFGDLKQKIKDRAMMTQESLLETLQSCIADCFDKDFTKYFLTVAKQYKHAANQEDMH